MKKFLIIPIALILLFLSKQTFSQSYSVIVSSHNSQNIAKKQVSKLHATGFTNANYIAPATGNKFRVYIDSFESKKDAISCLRKYSSTYKDAWIFEQQNDIKSEKATSTNVKSLTNRINSNKTQLDSLLQEVYRFKYELILLKAQLNENKDTPQQDNNKDTPQLDELDSLTEQIENLNNKISTVEKDFAESEKKLEEFKKNNTIQQPDTTSFALDGINSKFELNNHRLTIGFDFLQSNVLSYLDDSLLNYLNIDEGSSISNFYGLGASVFYNFTKSFSAGIDLNTYLYNYSAYLFPTLSVKYTKKLPDTPIKFSSHIGFGTDAIFISNDNSQFGNFIIAKVGFGLEYGLSDYFSAYTGLGYSMHYPIDENQYSPINLLNYKFGIRFNIF